MNERSVWREILKIGVKVKWEERRTKVATRGGKTGDGVVVGKKQFHDE